MKSIVRPTLALLAIGMSLIMAGCNEQQVKSKQVGYRGTAMVQLEDPKTEAALVEKNKLPDAIDPVDTSTGDPASKTYQNVKVLGAVNENEFVRLMAAITAWVAPEQGCTYCHNPENLADDSLYTKVVARRMIQMTQHINAEWKDHVGSTGVTCYTCHRGQPVPANIWFSSPEVAHGSVGNRAGQNAPSPVVDLASLPNDPFTGLLGYANEIRVIGKTALPTNDNPMTIKQTEVTYGLMMHISEALGVNCTFCHNSRSFADWDQSTPQRSTAWYGIRMVRDLNANYLTPLASTFPKTRLGVLGDSPKINCATCHQGVNKPLYGVSMVKDYPELTPASAK